MYLASNYYSAYTLTQRVFQFSLVLDSFTPYKGKMYNIICYFPFGYSNQYYGYMCSWYTLCIIGHIIGYIL